MVATSLVCSGSHISACVLLAVCYLCVICQVKIWSVAGGSRKFVTMQAVQVTYKWLLCFTSGAFDHLDIAIWRCATTIKCGQHPSGVTSQQLSASQEVYTYRLLSCEWAVAGPARQSRKRNAAYLSRPWRACLIAIRQHYSLVNNRLQQKFMRSLHCIEQHSFFWSRNATYNAQCIALDCCQIESEITCLHLVQIEVSI